VPGKVPAALGAKVYFVSCGPGDPDLLTIAGLKAIRESVAILAPALFVDTFSGFLEGKEVASPFTMDYDTLVKWIEERLLLGSVSFLVPGDFSTFSPFQSFVSCFKDRSTVIPGVGAHSAAAAILKKTWDMAGVAHCTVVTSPRAITKSGRVRLSDYGGPGKTLILYMINLPLEELVSELLNSYPPSTGIAILERIGADGETVTQGTLGDIASKVGDRDPFNIGSVSAEPSLALVIVGDVLEADETRDEWNYRYEKLWKPRNMR
jgi:precorrin-4/cobalt-precorrin-4 C11-methyltransferase